MSKNLMIGKTLAGLSMVLLLGACANKMMEMPAPMAATASAPAPAQQPMMAPPRPAMQAPPAPVQMGPIPGSLADFQTNVGDTVFFA